MASSTEVETAPNTVAVEETSATTRRIVITVPAEAVDERIEASFGTLQHESAIPGFRKGRAPRALLEKRFGEALIKETRGQIIADAYSKALEEKGIRPVGDPDIAPEVADRPLERGKPFSFAVDVEVIPDFTMPELDGIPVTKPVADVTDEHVAQEILRQSYRWGTPNRIDGPFEHLDRMVGRAEVRIAGRDGTFFETDQALVVVPAKEDEGKGQVLGLMIDGLDAILLGRKPGDTVVIETTGPEQHEREEVRGAKLTITYTIAAAERITPASVADLVERFSLQSEDILREQIRFALEQRRDAEQRNAQREQVFEWLLSKVDFELPAKLSERQVTRTLSRQRMEMLYRGLEPDVVERRLAELRGSSEQSTRDRLRLFFVMARLAEQFGVTVTEQELSGRIHMLAQQQNVRPDQLRAQLSKSGGLDDLAIQIREHKTADRLLEKAVVTEVPAEQWNEQVQAKTAERLKSRAAGKGR